MHLPRSQIAQLYTQLTRTTQPSSAPVLILTALTVDGLCATRILATLLKRDFILHTIVPVAGYTDLQRIGAELVLPLTRQRGGDGGTVVCLGLGGAVALEEILGLAGDGEQGQEAGSAPTPQDMSNHGVEIWLVDAHRPLNLDNVFGVSCSTPQDGDVLAVTQRPGVAEGKVLPSYRTGRGGVIVWEDVDLQAELQVEKDAYFGLQGMPDITEDDLAASDGDDSDASETGSNADREDDPDIPSGGQKRKRRSSSRDATSDVEGEEHEDEDGSSRPRRRRRSNSSTSISVPVSPGGNLRSAQGALASTPPTLPSSPPQRREPSARQMRKTLLKLRQKHEATLENYYSLGSSAAEPVSSMLYSLASELGREDNDLLWLAIVGISSVTISPSGPGAKAEQIREVLQDEVRRLNPVPDSELLKSQHSDVPMPSTARSPSDTSIRLSPEPRFLLIRHWSLYESMLHSPYLATRLQIWSDSGRKRLHKLLAKMGVSLQEAGMGYLHMDSEIKRTLRKRILKFAEQYNLQGLVPGEDGRAGLQGWGFVRSWGWRGTLSAEDVAVIVGAILEVGVSSLPSTAHGGKHGPSSTAGSTSSSTYNNQMRALPPTPPHSSDGLDADPSSNPSTSASIPDYITQRFFLAYDSLAPSSGLSTLLTNIPSAQNLYKAILRVGSALVNKRQIRHLRAFRMGVVKEGPDVPLFTHPGALVRLAAWVAEAAAVLESERGVTSRRGHNAKDHNALVLAALDEARAVYVVVGLGGQNGWTGSSRRIRSRKELQEREEQKRTKAAAKQAKNLARKKKRAEQKRLRQERNAANGIFDSDDDDAGSDDEDLETESSASSSNSDSGSDENPDDDDDDPASARARARKLFHGPTNRFAQSFQEVVEETGARVRIDSFDHSVVEVRKEDLAMFLEGLSLKTVVA